MGTGRVDVAVVGAGPAGSAAAVTARDLGLSVTLLDKATFPRDKTCGDGLTTSALRLLEQLGLRLDALGSFAPVREAVLVSPRGRHVPVPLPRGGHYAGVVPRAELDTALVDLARRRGADVREGAAIAGLAVHDQGGDVSLAGGETLRARFVVAADGHYSPVRRLLHSRLPARSRPPPDLGTWHAFRRYYHGIRDPRMWVLFEEDLLPGYAWVFPLPGGRANVGFGIPRRAGTDGRELAAHWNELLARDSVRAALGDGAEAGAPARAWPIPTRFEPGRLAAGPVLFAGDAAAVVDPMTGEGIAQAIETGRAAAHAVANGGDATAVALRYRRAVIECLGRDLRLATMLQRVLASPLGARAALRAVDLGDWTRRNFGRWMFEDYPRALLVTPRRWRRGALAGRGAYHRAA